MGGCVLTKLLKLSEDGVGHSYWLLDVIPDCQAAGGMHEVFPSGPNQFKILKPFSKPGLNFVNKV